MLSQYRVVTLYTSKIIDRMGSVCYSEEVTLNERPDVEKQHIKVAAVDALKEIQFSFTTQKLIHVNADLLVLFMDHSTNIKRNDHFLKLPMQASKLEEHLKAHLARRHDKPCFITFNIIIPTLNFSRVSVLFCDIWKEGLHNDTQFKDVLREYFDSIAEDKVRSMAITEPPSELGAHLQLAVRRILREIVNQKKKPENIEFCCLGQQSKSVFMQGVHQNKEDLQKSFGSISESNGSVYY